MPTFNPAKLAKYTTDTSAPFHCNVVEGHCEKDFKNASGIIMHCNRSHGKTDPNGAGRKRPRKVRCTICGEKFSRGAGITKHMRAAHPDETEPASRKAQPLVPVHNGNGSGRHSRRDALVLASPLASAVMSGRKLAVYCPHCGTNMVVVQQALDFVGQS